MFLTKIYYVTDGHDQPVTLSNTGELMAFLDEGDAIAMVPDRVLHQPLRVVPGWVCLPAEASSATRPESLLFQFVKRRRQFQTLKSRNDVTEAELSRAKHSVEELALRFAESVVANVKAAD